MVKFMEMDGDLRMGKNRFVKSNWVGWLVILFLASCAHTPGQLTASKQKAALKHEQIGNNHYDHGRLESAAHEWEIALDLDPQRDDLRQRLLSVRAGKTWDQKAEVPGENVSGKQEKVIQELKKAENYYQNSQLKDAEVTWRHVLTLAPKDQTAIQGLARLEEERYNKSHERSFDLMTEDLYLQGMKCYRKKEWVLAEAKLSEAANLNPEQPQVKRYLDGVREELKRTADRHIIQTLVEQARQAETKMAWLEANRLWQKVLELDREHEDAKNGLSRSQAKLEKWADRELVQADQSMTSGQYAKAGQGYQQVLNVFPKNGRALKGRQLVREALAQGRQSASQKSMAEKAFNQGVAHYRAGRIDQAILEWEKAVQNDPDDAEYQEWLTRAKKEKSGAMEQNKQRAQVVYQDGLAAYQRGELNQAYLLWKETLELDPDHQKARINIKKIKQEME